MKLYVTFLICLSALPFRLFSYGALSEFISADQTHYRDTSTEAIFSTDIIQDPKWADASFPLQLSLCTNAGYTSTNVRYQTTKATELLSDISAAQSTWSFGTGSSLTFLSPNTNSACSSSTSRKIYFASLSAGVLAMTPTTISVSGGKLVITDAEIVFSSSASFNLLTHSCRQAGSPSGTCTTSATPFTFLGILTHEMGHLIGIAHTMINDDNDSDGIYTQPVMYPAIGDVAESEANESLKLDDQLAREYLYPETNFPANTGGSISGYVMRTATSGQRGAHVSVFDLTLNRTITGAYTSISGTRKNPDGAFAIQGIPFDTDFALFVEPVDRSSDGLSTSYLNINTPIAAALDSELDGFLNFKIEAYPDVPIPDVRLTGNAAGAPGFSSAKVFRLTSGSPNISGIKFYISKSAVAPNDAASASLAFNSKSTITTDNPLTVTLANPVGLEIFDKPTVTLSAKIGSETKDWSKGLSAFTYTGTESTITVDPTSIDASNGDYVVTATLTDSRYGTISTAGQFTIRDWHAEGVSGTSSDGGGSSGCELSAAPGASNFSGLILGLLFIATILGLKRVSGNRSLLGRRFYRVQSSREELEPQAPYISHRPHS